MSNAKHFHFSARYSILGTFLKNILLLVSNSFCDRIHSNIQLLLFSSLRIHNIIITFSVGVGYLQILMRKTHQFTVCSTLAYTNVILQ